MQHRAQVTGEESESRRDVAFLQVGTPGRAGRSGFVQMRGEGFAGVGRPE